MNDINLTQALMKKMAPYPRKPGRYNVSELYFLLDGSTTPEKFLNPDPRTVKEMLTMWNGIGAHAQLENLVGREYAEKKAEFFYKEITVVGKADLLPPNDDAVYEWKSSERKMKEAKPWHLHQAKAYCTMFKKSKGKVFQPLQNKDGIYLKHLGTVDRDDAWFQGELERLYQFHLQVEVLRRVQYPLITANSEVNLAAINF